MTGPCGTATSYSVVIPTLARASLTRCLAALAEAPGPAPASVVLVDDRPGRPGTDLPTSAGLPLRVVATGGAGPAAARNAGWRATRTEWVAFLDDDVTVMPSWRQHLAGDLFGQPARVAGVQGRIIVPEPPGRAPTDWERGTMGLAGARWVTADMAYRRAALADSGGFDERFPRAFREDADLALRLLDDGWELRAGQRETIHPVRPASPWASVRVQAGNADDALMTALHGPGWRVRAGASRGRIRRHALITAAAAAAAGLAAAGRPRAAAGAAAVALAGTAEFAAARIAPGPKTLREVATMVATSLVIPEAACWHRLRGRRAARHARPWPPPAKAVLFDRDGTLIEDVPYNGDPALVALVPGARAAVGLARGHGLRVGLITNQSGIARGLLSRAEADAVNARLAELLGPLDVVLVCPHAESDQCSCRKPAPGMVYWAAAELGIAAHEIAVIGDIGADVQAARRAGARGFLVPAPATRPAERSGVRAAPDVAAAAAMAAGVRRPGPVWPAGGPE
ncbi:MAG TPA: HAD-IIIA family hydrolase [Streptosporangiaceae bacterium]|jgi:HAD superfamily hydrolase (TIGR01662 family)